MTEDEMVGWHDRQWHRGHEFEQVLRVGDRQGSLACCSPWGRKKSDMTERPNRTDGDDKMWGMPGVEGLEHRGFLG